MFAITTIVQFQMVYCLKGWFQTEFEGVGVQRLEAGSSWLQPPGIRHTVVGWSDDCELLEIIVPAQHETVNDTYAKGPAVPRCAVLSWMPANG